VTRATTVLVRGDSSAWAFGDYGTKERDAARIIRDGGSIALVQDTEFRKLIERGKKARVSDTIAGQPVRWLSAATKRQFKHAAAIDGPLDREHSVLGRVEQSYLRRRLFGSREIIACALCGRRVSVVLLVAAHIKPRSECSRLERLDVDNIAFALCLLGCDALYDRGFVAVRTHGYIVISDVQVSRDVRTVLRRFHRRRCTAWTPSNAKYFQWHLARRFQGAKHRPVMQ